MMIAAGRLNRGMFASHWVTRGLAAMLAVAVVVTFASTFDEMAKSSRQLDWLRSRLAFKRAQVRQHRVELAAVAASVQRLAQQTGDIEDRTATLREATGIDDGSDGQVSMLRVAATLQGDEPTYSNEALETLSQLAWIEDQATSLDDSVDLLMALLEERHEGEAGGVPTRWPVRGQVSSGFGHRTPVGGGGSFHSGLDIRAQRGTPVRVASAGTVAFAGRQSGYGSLVVVDHGGGIKTLYAHLSAMFVEEGAKVKPGDVVGAVGSSGRATGSHLHYEVRVAGRPVDPRPYLAHAGA